MSEESSPQPREIAEQRGDFMLLPPLTPTFGRPARLQQDPADYLVTRRPTAVTTAGLAHAVDHELIGRVTGRGRRARGRRRSVAADLDHLITPADTEDLDETPQDSESLPMAPTPRVLRSAPSAVQPQRRVPASMPSRAEVRRAVSAPAPSTQVSQPNISEPEVDIDAALAELPPSTFPSVGQSSPVVRRRRGAEPPTQQAADADIDAPEQRDEAPPADVVVPRDGTEPPAIRRRQPRGRVHQPPEDLLSSAPFEQPSLSSASRTQDLRSSADVIESVSEAPSDQSAINDLVHRTRDEEPNTALASTAPASTAPASTAPAASSAPPAATPAADADVPMSKGSESAVPPTPSMAPLAPGSTGIQRRARDDAGSSALSDLSTPATTSSSAPDVAPPSGTSSEEASAEISGGAVSGESRPLLGTGPSSSPVASGSSGIQRRARDEVGSSTSSGASDTPGPSAPSTSLRSSTASTPSVPGVAPTSGEASGESRPLWSAGPSSPPVAPASTGIQRRARDDVRSAPSAATVAGVASSSGEQRPSSADDPPVSPVNSRIQRRARDRAEPSASPASEVSTASSSAAAVPADSAVAADPAEPVEPASRPLLADVPPIGSPELSAIQRRSRDESDALERAAAAAGPDIAVQGSLAHKPNIERVETPVTPGSSDSESNPSEPAVGVDSTHSQPPATPKAPAGGRTSGSTAPAVSPADATASVPASRGPSASRTAAGSTSRPILASSGRTGIQRRERRRAADGDASQSGGLADLGSMPEPRVQGPRRMAVPEPVRQILRETVGEPPAHVTVHEGGAAGEMTDSVNAEAFTRDGQIYFAGDSPVDSPRGQQLLAHELTHVIQQQGRAGSMPGEHTDEGQDLERAARQVEDHMVNGRGRSARAVVRAPKSESEEPAPLHHRTGSMDAPSMRSSGAGAVTSSGSQAISPAGGGSIVSSSAHGVDAGVQRKSREPSRAILDGIGDTASKAWSKSRESLLGQLEQEFSGPPKSNKEPDSRAKQLERQAADLYPYLRRRLRAELVRDLERRGRL